MWQITNHKLIVWLGLTILVAQFASIGQCQVTQPTTAPLAEADFKAAASDVTAYIQTTYFLPKDNLYAHSVKDRHPDFMWGNGIIFSALVGASRYDPRTYLPIMSKFFDSMDRYWDKKAPHGGYEPSPTSGNGNDKYYDDNAWMVLTFAEAYEMTGDRRYLRKAQQSLEFVLSGLDDVAGGGIWWHEAHKGDSKNTCVNAPAAVGCLRLARYETPEKAKVAIATAKEISDWTTKTFQAKDGLFGDGMKVTTGHINEARLTYNTALMIRAYLGLYKATHDESYFNEAKRVAAASDWFLDKKTNAYRDSVKWSHLMVEADLEMYRATKDEHLLKRAIANANYEYKSWQEKKPETVIDNASIARTLWLMVDATTPEGQKFWEKVDK